MASLFQIVGNEELCGDFSANILGKDSKYLYFVDSQGNLFRICHEEVSLVSRNGTPFWVSIHIERVSSIPLNVLQTKCGVQLNIKIPKEHFAFRSFNGIMPECIDMGDLKAYHFSYFRYFDFPTDKFESVKEMKERLLFGQTDDSIAVSNIFFK